ncbi:MAG: FMN-dependent NADH-azoreductase [Phormidesmis sp. RL_2_1]|nr:FMN-dependent NADH-azoreductase [Phormidesmis sp. RL_2_1]
MNILRVDASARYQDSVSRQLTDELIARLQQNTDATVTTRDLGQGIPLLNEAMVIAYNTPADARSAEQKDLLSVSDLLIEELKAADTLVIGCPIYNFSVPAALKAYIDLVARAGLTFNYSSAGPVGLLRDRPTYIIITSGGTPVGSDIDFTSGYLKHVLGFIGIHTVEIIAADSLARTGSEKLAQVQKQLQSI